jgi:predicted SnoaL-like aldol condensation-catalyzing enzyme
MDDTDPKQIALQFNESINSQDVHGLSDLMTVNHRFMDRAGESISGKESMTQAWTRFFELFPEYRNTFERVERTGNVVILYGYATWKKGGPPDYAIWTATIENGLVAEWRIYEDCEENKAKLRLMLPDEVDKTRKGSG